MALPKKCVFYLTWAVRFACTLRHVWRESLHPAYFAIAVIVERAEPVFLACSIAKVLR